MLRITACLLFLSPVIASAQCLTADAVETGIMVEYGNGDISYISRSETGTLTNAVYDLDSYGGFIYIFESQDGVFPLSISAYREGSWSKFSDSRHAYDFPLATASDLSVGASGYGPVTESDIHYGDELNTFVWSVFESDPLQIGDCTYDAVRVFTYTTNISDGDIEIAELKFLPQLGLALPVGGGYMGMSPADGEIIGLTSG